MNSEFGVVERKELIDLSGNVNIERNVCKKNVYRKRVN